MYFFYSSVFSSFQDAILGSMEKVFYGYGRAIAKYPILFILLSLLLTVLSGLGMAKMRMENNGIKLWIPYDSTQRTSTDWLWENYPPELRFASMIFVADNVLEPENIKSMYALHKRIEEIVTPQGLSWSDLCMKAPVVKPPPIADFLGRRKRQATNDSNDNFDFDFEFEEDDFFDEVMEEDDPFGFDTPSEVDMGEYVSVELYPDPYCQMVDDLPLACLEMSLLELWANDGKYDSKTDEEIENLTLDVVIEKVNGQNKSGVFLLEKNFTEFLSNVEYDKNGKIIAAQATLIRWLGKMNATDAKINPVKGRGEPIDQATFDFEAEMIAAMLNTSDYPPDLKSYPNVKRSFGDIASSTILGDVSVMAIGYMIVFVYVNLMLGRFNMLEQRSGLAFAGFLGVIMGIVVSYGLCSAFGLFFGPMHSVLPFLLLGIGIDDMFVIVQSWDTLQEEKRKRLIPGEAFDEPMSDRMGEALSHAGVAITITSITDVIAFGIGGTTILPALSSFCIYASVGIVATYFFQCTFFVACLSLDIKRFEANRNACCPFIKHDKDWKSNACSQGNFIQKAFKFYGRLITKTPMKIIIMIITLALLGVGIYGNILLRQEFNPAWFLPPDTYLAKWFEANKKYFPFGGDRVTIWCSDVDYITEFDKLNQLSLKLENQTDIIDKVDSWTQEFDRYKSIHHLEETKTYDQAFTQFLFSPKGGKYRERFKFDSDLNCGQSAPLMRLSQITFQHRIFSGPEEHVPAMNRVKDIIREVNLTRGQVFPLSIGYASWETDEVIAFELYRNIALAIGCISVTTIILLANISAALLVLLCVVLSLVDIGGFMHFWGLTIDTVSCNNLIIAIGLCVDYSAHIAHRYLVEAGNTRQKRVENTLANIGPAVMNGGITTTLAFILLAGSKSHVFSTFFKIFFLVVTFGLFHGLATLPVLLSIVGPNPHSAIYSEEASENNEEIPRKSHSKQNQFEDDEQKDHTILGEEIHPYEGKTTSC